MEFLHSSFQLGPELLGNQTKKGRDKELIIPFNHKVEIFAFPSTGYLKTKFSHEFLECSLIIGPQQLFIICTTSVDNTLNNKKIIV